MVERRRLANMLHVPIARSVLTRGRSCEQRARADEGMRRAIQGVQEGPAAQLQAPRRGLEGLVAKKQLGGEAEEKHLAREADGRFATAHRIASVV
jgi:hypothetical protein